MPAILPPELIILPDDPIAAGLQALSEARWVDARRAFEAALALDAKSAEALEGLGMSAWWSDDSTTVFGARERAYQLYRERGDRVGAARVALALAEDYRYFRGEAAVSHGWHRLAERLLEGVDPAPEHGWVKLSEADHALYVDGDAERAERLARQSAELGRSLGAVDLEMVGLALSGLALVAQGQLPEGMSRLDEAVAAALSGEMTDYVAIGFCCCYLVGACERVRDYDRAAQWCERVREYSERIRFNMLFAVCRAQHATVLVWQGHWSEAESELSGAVAQLSTVRPALQSEGIVRLAELRRLQGRYDEALELLRQAEAHPLSLLGRAAVALDRGSNAEAQQLAEWYLRRTPESNLVERLAGLDVLARACSAREEHERARAVLAELQTVATALGTDPVLGLAHFARGIVCSARGELEPARRAFEDALALFARSGGSYHCARARLELARVVAELGGDTAAATLRDAIDTFRTLGASAEQERAQELLDRLRPPPVGESRLTEREIEVLRHVARGLSNRQIALQLFLSEHTVKRHIANSLTKLGLRSRAAAVAHAVRSGLL